MAWWHWPVRIGGWAAAPFTGGLSAVGAEGAIQLDNAFNKDDKGGGQPSVGGQPNFGLDPKNAEFPFLSQLQQASTANRSQGANLAGQGQEALQPVMQYLTQLAGGDPAALMDASRQERGRVIDQYDTARRAISQFGPRGGGTTSALAESRFQQAESLADITSTARRDAAGQLATLGPQLTALGLTSNQLASSDLNSVIESILTREGFDVQKRGQNMETAGAIGEAAATLIGIWLGRDKG